MGTGSEGITYGERVMSQFYESETILADDYPVYTDYYYVCDGEVRQCEIMHDPDWPCQPTVFELRISMNVSEVRRCDLRARGLL